MVYLIAIQNAAATQQALDTVCATTAPTNGPTATPSAACQNAVNTLAANTVSCTPTAENPQIFCTGDCRQYYDDVIDNCDEAVSQVAIMCEISSVCTCLVFNYTSIVS